LSKHLKGRNKQKYTYLSVESLLPCTLCVLDSGVEHLFTSSLWGGYFTALSKYTLLFSFLAQLGQYEADAIILATH
jgi:hypothetical protein